MYSGIAAIINFEMVMVLVRRYNRATDKEVRYE